MPEIVDEAGRLAALRRYNILDTAKECEFENIIDLVQVTFGVPMAAISLIDTDRQWFKAQRGLDIDEAPRAMAFCDYTIRSDDVMTIPDARRDPRFGTHPFVVTGPGIRCYMGAPLTTRDNHNIGSLCIIGTEPRNFRDDEMVTLEKFAKLVVRQIELREMAAHDSLTGALSRGAFADRIDIAHERFKRRSEKCSFAILDLDHFKAINDTYGHLIGDDVLKAVVGTIVKDLRRGDSIGRLGGEEFGILLEGLKSGDVEVILERLRTRISQLRFDAAPDLVVTVSIGLAHVDEGFNLCAEWFDVADGRLYAAKNGGRNMLVAA